ncbi:MAG: YbhB/YbcL family Raf kinase inhibitor-like protein, partial [Candidatus Nanoarchaeia archaeon]
MKKFFKIFLLFGFIFLLIIGQSFGSSQGKIKGGKRMEIKSSAFVHGGMMPAKYAYDKENISPPLVFSNIPSGTKSLALICDDPDAPVGNWVHWVIYNIPADTKELKEGIPPKKELQNGAKQGINDYRQIGYGGPCPPSGTHRYIFKLY